MNNPSVLYSKSFVICLWFGLSLVNLCIRCEIRAHICSLSFSLLHKLDERNILSMSHVLATLVRVCISISGFGPLVCICSHACAVLFGFQSVCKNLWNRGVTPPALFFFSEWFDYLMPFQILLEFLSAFLFQQKKMSTSLWVGVVLTHSLPFWNHGCLLMKSFSLRSSELQVCFMSHYVSPALPWLHLFPTEKRFILFS